MTTVLGVLILICAVFLIAAILFQSSKNHRMSGVVSGGAETFFGKQKGKTIDAALSKATAVFSVIFCVLVLALYLVTAKANKAPEQTEGTADTDITTQLPATTPTEDTDNGETDANDGETVTNDNEADAEGGNTDAEDGDADAEPVPAA